MGGRNSDFFFSVWEVKFHPNNPDHLFTCSEDGSVWHWDGTTVAQSATGTGKPKENT